MPRPNNAPADAAVLNALICFSASVASKLIPSLAADVTADVKN
jgi:hypothetical protein